MIDPMSSDSTLGVNKPRFKIKRAPLTFPKQTTLISYNKVRVLFTAATLLMIWKKQNWLGDYQRAIYRQTVLLIDCLKRFQA